jgi:hypothetical protein
MFRYEGFFRTFDDSWSYMGCPLFGPISHVAFLRKPFLLLSQFLRVPASSRLVRGDFDGIKLTLGIATNQTQRFLSRLRTRDLAAP